MNKEEYLFNIEKSIIKILKDFKFNNYKKQLISKKLKADFNSTYNEEYLWNKVLYISNNSCILITESINEKLTTTALRESAEIYELFSQVSEEYDKNYCFILSALCYDLSGYQANALCMLKGFKNNAYKFEGIDYDNISEENYILLHIQGILLKNIFKTRKLIEDNTFGSKGLEFFKQSMISFYDNILNGNEGEFLEDINKAYKYYMLESNIPISNLLLLLKTRFGLYVTRSIWKNLNYSVEIKNNPIWKKYIKLLTYDLYNKNSFKNENDIVSRFELWTSQLRAIEKGLLSENKNYIIQMPTSAGKTFIAEISILNNLINYPNKKCIYIAPFRALTSEKEEELSHNLGKLGYIVSSISGSYEIDDFQELTLKQSDLLIATPEKIDLLFRLEPDFFNNVSLIVIDEGHILGDISPRSTLLEFLIIRLKIKIPLLKILFISAVIPYVNAEEYSMWLNGDKSNVIRANLFSNDTSLEKQWEPTRKLIGKFNWVNSKGKVEFIDIDIIDEDTKIGRGAFVPSIIESKHYGRSIFPKVNNKGETAAELGYKLSENGNTLIFCSQVRNTQYVGEALLKLFTIKDNIRDEFNDDIEKESYYYSKIWYGENSYITKCIKKGVGVHFGDMPEQVRTAVEGDFRVNKLRILISTNTIGQGINFPLKNIIFHSTLLNQVKKISNRDFWNIVGRVGRAGKETEGQIIFLINSDTDRESYKFYINKKNLEPANSLFFTSLNLLLSKRIDLERFKSITNILSEPYMFDLLVEETLGVDEIIENIINNSLFKIQIEEKGLDISELKNMFISYSNKLKEENTIDELKIYGKTGFSLKSNKKILEFIKDREKEINTFLNEDNYIELLKYIFALFDTLEINEVLIEKLSYTQKGIEIYKKPGDFLDITILWINGSNLEDLKCKWKDIENIGDDEDKFYILFSQGFYYKYAWGISAFISILSSYLNIDIKDLPENIKNLSSYIKYGLNDKKSCFLRSLGIKNRDICKDYSENFKSIKDITLWLSNISKNDINHNYSGYDIDNILDVGLKLLNKDDESIFDKIFQIKLIFNSNYKYIIKGNVLSIEREENNIYDPYSILIKNGDDKIGYVPRNISKRIIIDMDIDNKIYLLKVENIEYKGSYNDIYCSIYEVDF